MWYVRIGPTGICSSKSCRTRAARCKEREEGVRARPRWTQGTNLEVVPAELFHHFRQQGLLHLHQFLAWLARRQAVRGRLLGLLILNRGLLLQDGSNTLVGD